MPKKKNVKPTIDWNSNLDDFKNAAKNVGSGVNSFLKPGGGLDELTGANDVKRFIQNPSIPNLGGVALSATQYVGGPAAQQIARGISRTARYTTRVLPDQIARTAQTSSRYASRIIPDEIARTAGSASRYAARVIPDEVGRTVTKVLRLGNNTGQLNTLQNTTRQIAGRSVSTERVISPAKIAQGRALYQASQSTPKIAGMMQGMAVANVIRQTEKLSNKKNNKKK